MLIEWLKTDYIGKNHLQSEVFSANFCFLAQDLAKGSFFQRIIMEGQTPLVLP